MVVSAATESVTLVLIGPPPDSPVPGIICVVAGAAPRLDADSGVPLILYMPEILQSPDISSAYWGLVTVMPTLPPFGCMISGYLYFCPTRSAACSHIPEGDVLFPPKSSTLPVL